MEKQRVTTGRKIGNRRFRDVVGAGFRRRRLVAISFLAIFTATAAALVLMPETYKSEMKILVKRGRVDPMVTTESTALPRVAGVTEQDLSSEIELLRSRDLLEQAVADCRLDVPRTGPFHFVFGPLKLNASATDAKPDPIAWEEAARRLEKELQIVPLRGSNLIAASYESEDAKQAACVLNALAKRYVDKHLAVHRPAGTFEFFKAEAERYRKELASIEAEMMKLGPGEGLVSTGVEREITLRKFGDFSLSVAEKKSAIAEVEARIRTLEQQAANLKDRHTTEIRTLHNPQLAPLQSTLMSLRMKRLEMLEKYAPTYRTVQELDRQIQEVEVAVAVAQRHPITEESTNRDPAYEWTRLELAKARSELAALRAAVPGAASAAQAYRARAAELDRQGIMRQDLVRMAKVAEETYLLYLRKQEEARISDELDRQRILNVAVAEQATVSLVPTHSKTPLRFAFAAVLAGLMSLGLGVGADYSRRTFHTPTDVTTILGVPTLAAFPRFGDGAMNSQQGVNRS